MFVTTTTAVPLNHDPLPTPPLDRPIDHRQRLVRCLRLVPWTVFLCAGAFAAGIAFWVAGTVAARDATVQFGEAIGIEGAATAWLRATVTTAVAAITIGASSVVGLALLLSLVRTYERGLLLGACGGGGGGGRGSSSGDDAAAPIEPWLFKAYQAVAIVLNILVWALLVVCVGLLVVALVWWGAFAGVSSAISDGVAQGDAALAPTGLTVGGTSDIAAAAGAAAAALGLAPANLRLPFAPVCPPVCLNAGSFAQVLRMRESCVCGSDALGAARALSGRVATSAAISLAGAGAMWAASCLLLVVLAGHAVVASFDRRSARWLKERRAERALEGYAADGKDLAAAYGSGNGAGAADHADVMDAGRGDANPWSYGRGAGGRAAVYAPDQQQFRGGAVV